MPRGQKLTQSHKHTSMQTSYHYDIKGDWRCVKITLTYSHSSLSRCSLSLPPPPQCVTHSPFSFSWKCPNSPNLAPNKTVFPFRRCCCCSTLNPTSPTPPDSHSNSDFDSPLLHVYVICTDSVRECALLTEDTRHGIYHRVIGTIVVLPPNNGWEMLRHKRNPTTASRNHG